MADYPVVFHRGIKRAAVDRAQAGDVMREQANNTAIIYWDDLAVESKTYRPRYYGFAVIDGKKYRISGDISDATRTRCVRLVFREQAPPKVDIDHRAGVDTVPHTICKTPNHKVTQAMLVKDMIVSKFLRKEDVEDEIIVTMKSVKLEEMPGDTAEERWALSFKELEKAMILNTTTIRVLEKAFGPDSDSWIGKKVVLYTDPNVSFKGQVVGGLRLRPLKTPAPVKAATPAKAKKAKAEAPVIEEEEFDSEIP